jgi:hypothetical protein
MTQPVQNPQEEESDRKRKLTLQEMVAYLESKGCKRLPPDHPIYSEGPLIIFSSRSRRPSTKQGTASAPTTSQPSTDSPPNKPE